MPFRSQPRAFMASMTAYAFAFDLLGGDAGFSIEQGAAAQSAGPPPNDAPRARPKRDDRELGVAEQLELARRDNVCAHKGEGSDAASSYSPRAASSLLPLLPPRYAPLLIWRAAEMISRAASTYPALPTYMSVAQQAARSAPGREPLMPGDAYTPPDHSGQWKYCAWRYLSSAYMMTEEPLGA